MAALVYDDDEVCFICDEEEKIFMLTNLSSRINSFVHFAPLFVFPVVRTMFHFHINNFRKRYG